MEFSTLHYGQVLHLSNNEELKNRIRNFEKTKKQIISAQYHILFNQRYMNGKIWLKTFLNTYFIKMYVTF